MKTIQIIATVFLLHTAVTIFGSENFDEVAKNLEIQGFRKVPKSLKNFKKALDNLDRAIDLFLTIKNHPEYVFFFSKEELIGVALVVNDFIPLAKKFVSMCVETYKKYSLQEMRETEFSVKELIDLKFQDLIGYTNRITSACTRKKLQHDSWFEFSKKKAWFGFDFDDDDGGYSP